MVGEVISIISEFQSYKDKVADTVVLLTDISGEGRVKIVKPADRSRYFAEGRDYIASRIRRRVGKYQNVDGVMLTLTFAPKLIGKREAWACCGKYVGEVLNVINQYRYRRRWKRLSYFWVVEVQRGTGYPHVHVFFPKLKWLAPAEYLRSVCRFGRANVKRMGGVNGAAYICKYISKMDGWSELAQALLWKGRQRLYSFSKGYFNALEKKAKEWVRHTVKCMRESFFILRELERQGMKVKQRDLISLCPDDWIFNGVRWVCTAFSWNSEEQPEKGVVL